MLALLVLATALSTTPALAGDPLVRPGAWNPKKTPKGWVVVETDNYQVQSEVGEAKARAVGDHLEGMLELYREFLPFKKRMPTFVLKVFESRESFLDYGSPPTAAAYYDKRNKELVSYDTGIILGVRDIPPEIALTSDFEGEFTDEERARLDDLFVRATESYLYDLASVLAHEGWHQYFHYYTVSWVAMPSWLDEGLGDYFFTAHRDDSEDGYELGAPNQTRLRIIHRAFEDGSSVTFDKLMDFEQRDYYSNASVYYAQGWSMVHFLMQHPDERRRELIPKLIKDFKRSKNFRKSTDKVFKELDLDELDSEWIGWVLSHEPEDPLKELAQEFGSKIAVEHLNAPDRWKTAYERHLLDQEEGARGTSERGTGRGEGDR